MLMSKLHINHLNGFGFDDDAMLFTISRSFFGNDKPTMGKCVVSVSIWFDSLDSSSSWRERAMKICVSTAVVIVVVLHIRYENNNNKT